MVYLDGGKDLVAQRIEKRHGHFMPPSLLASQFAALQPPAESEHPIVVDIAKPVAAQVEAIVEALARRREAAS